MNELWYFADEHPVILCFFIVICAMTIYGLWYNFLQHMKCFGGLNVWRRVPRRDKHDNPPNLPTNDKDSVPFNDEGAADHLDKEFMGSLERGDHVNINKMPL